MVKLALLWHMHQPYYEDLATGEHLLPWVRLHAIKDYWGMAALLEEFPGVRVTFNLVPSLLVQVQAFAEDRARDRHLTMGLKPADDLGPDEAAWLVANGFHAPVARMIAPHPRYLELHGRRLEPHTFLPDDLRDLQVWHKLAWMDPDRLRRDARLVTLVEKGRGFSEADKAVLRSVELEILRQVIPAYRAAAERGHVELSTSPFYHPILPLLCDSDVHLRAHPDAARPRRRFVRPEDAREQITRAVAFHTKVFGRAPRGMWPSEGSVSDEAVEIAAGAGLQWVATDEDILARSIGLPMPRDASGHAERADVLYRPYLIGAADRPVACLFRDHELSDRLGFLYQSWDAAAAADDFLERVREAGRRFPAGEAGGDATVAVILDGENAWEHYAGGGRPFLRALYGALERSADIRTVTMSEAAAGAQQPLPSIFPGSWIHADFSIWIGHRDDHRAWAQLAEARDAFDRVAGHVEAAARARAFDEILIAEGSDWFWWYGDDHSSDHDRDFDDLFRRHLRNAYEALGLAPPDELHVSNISTGLVPLERLADCRMARPMLDGLDSSYLEWVGAATPALSRRDGAMHRASRTLIEEVKVGVTDVSLCLRIGGARLSHLMRFGQGALALAISAPLPRIVDIAPASWAAGSIVEVEVPLSALGVESSREIGLALLVRDGSGAVVDRAPSDREWLIAINPGGAGAWTV